VTSRVLVTGASGFVGGACLRELMQRLPRDTDFICLSRQRLPSTDRVRWIQADLKAPETYNAHLEDCDAVVHCAGLVEHSILSRKAMLEANVHATRELLNRCVENHVDTFVFMGSAGPYGNAQGVWHSEDDALPAHCQNPYDETKRLAHEVVRSHRDSGVRLVELMPVTIYGGGDAPLLRQLVAHLSRRRMFFTSLLEKRLTGVSIDNVARAAAEAVLNHEWRGPYILRDDLITMADVISVVEDTLGIRIHLMPFPTQVAVAFGAVNSLASLAVRRPFFADYDNLTFLLNELLVNSSRSSTAAPQSQALFAENIRSIAQHLGAY